MVDSSIGGKTGVDLRKEKISLELLSSQNGFDRCFSLSSLPLEELSVEWQSY
jgi:hypothetical protein